MGNADYYLHGSNNVICDRCGFKYKAKDVRLEWTGLYTCIEKCWEPRHPQDRIRAKKDGQPPAIIRSEPADQFITTAISADDL